MTALLGWMGWGVKMKEAVLKKSETTILFPESAVLDRFTILSNSHTTGNQEGEMMIGTAHTPPGREGTGYLSTGVGMRQGEVKTFLNSKCWSWGS